MITTNLSTRPFYNTRAVALWTALLALVVVAATAINAGRIIQYSRSDSSLAQQANADTEKAGALRAEAARLRASVDLNQVERVSSEASLANELIDRRVFSWTQLLNQFEQTLPPDVRITSVRPSVDKQGRILLNVSVVARGVDDVNQFMESLEKTGAFQNLLSRQERMNDNEQLESTLEMYYAPPSGGGQPAVTPSEAAAAGTASGAPAPASAPASPAPGTEVRR